MYECNAHPPISRLQESVSVTYPCFLFGILVSSWPGHFIKAMYSSLVDAIITDPELMAPAPASSTERGHWNYLYINLSISLCCFVSTSRVHAIQLALCAQLQICLWQSSFLPLCEQYQVLPLDDHAIVRTGPAKADRDSDSDRQSFLIEFNFLSLCIHSFGSSAWPGGMLSLTPVRSPTAAFIGGHPVERMYIYIYMHVGPFCLTVIASWQGRLEVNRASSRIRCHSAEGNGENQWLISGWDCIWIVSSPLPS